MIKLQNVSFQYSSEYDSNGIKDINLTINEGAFIVLCGKSGCGKTTVTRLINGLIPHFYEGELTGAVQVNGIDMKDVELSDMASICASVFQNPKSQFFNLDTTGEIAFGCENLNLEKAVIWERISKAKQDFCLENLMERNIFELSGGEKQQIACGSVYATDPQVYVFDEPSSNMDAKAIKRFQHILEKLKSQGKTIVIAEHRLYYLKELADQYVYFDKGEIVETYSKEVFTRMSQEALFSLGLRHTDLKQVAMPHETTSTQEEVLRFENLVCTKGSRKVLDIPELLLHKHEVVAIIGENGAGKTTFSEAVSGLIKTKGTLYLQDQKVKGVQRTAKSYIVMQDVNRQLFCASVEEELQLGVTDTNQDAHTLMQEMGIAEFAQRHPTSLSGGQKQRVAICSAIAAQKEIMFFDEPTSGLDYESMYQFAHLMKANKEKHLLTMIITHDLELVLGCCTHVLHLQNGQVFDYYPINRENIGKIKAYFIS